jgi:hypothetical protein
MPKGHPSPTICLPPRTSSFGTRPSALLSPVGQLEQLPRRIITANILGSQLRTAKNNPWILTESLQRIPKESSIQQRNESTQIQPSSRRNPFVRRGRSGAETPAILLPPFHNLPKQNPDRTIFEESILAPKPRLLLTQPTFPEEHSSPVCPRNAAQISVSLPRRHDVMYGTSPQSDHHPEVDSASRATSDVLPGESDLRSLLPRHNDKSDLDMNSQNGYSHRQSRHSAVPAALQRPSRAVRNTSSTSMNTPFPHALRIRTIKQAFGHHDHFSPSAPSPPTAMFRNSACPTKGDANRTIQSLERARDGSLQSVGAEHRVNVDATKPWVVGTAVSNDLRCWDVCQIYEDGGKHNHHHGTAHEIKRYGSMFVRGTPTPSPLEDETSKKQAQAKMSIPEHRVETKQISTSCDSHTRIAADPFTYTTSLQNKAGNSLSVVSRRPDELEPRPSSPIKPSNQVCAKTPAPEAWIEVSPCVLTSRLSNSVIQNVCSLIDIVALEHRETLTSVIHQLENSKPKTETVDKIASDLAPATIPTNSEEHHGPESEPIDQIGQVSPSCGSSAPDSELLMARHPSFANVMKLINQMAAELGLDLDAFQQLPCSRQHLVEYAPLHLR